MKSITFKISVPKSNEKWKVTIYRNGKHNIVRRTTAALLYSLIERQVLSFFKAKKTSKDNVVIKIEVSYSPGYDNGGTYDNPHDALYALICFLEEYITQAFLSEKSRKYTRKRRFS